MTVTFNKHETFCTSVYTIFGDDAAYLYVIKTEDISTHIAPTIDLCVDNFRIFVLKKVKYITDIMAIAVLLLHALSHLAFNHWLEKPINEWLNRRLIIN